jgi:hypothetical protein
MSSYKPAIDIFRLICFNQRAVVDVRYTKEILMTTDYYTHINQLFQKKLSEDVKKTLHERGEQTLPEDSNQDRMHTYIHEKQESAKAYVSHIPELQKLKEMDPVSAQKWEEYAMQKIEAMYQRMLRLCT